MFLKTLNLKGFKSFADSSTLTLEPGVTVVVGPNGSGKSNVVDAIAWVLGAQAPSAVRSQKMDDVIFAGAAKRPALGRAEVSLTIDNSAGLLPIDFTEVTITRTLFRSGESEYSLNNVPCRLLDIQELLSDSGVGRQQHVIVSQGQIDAVLNARPEDRRSVIEEAAGVLKFRKRRERAQRRLDSTETNMTRLTDLLREVRRQLRPLEKQAEAARRYDGVIAELGAFRLFVNGRELASMQRRLEGHASRRTEMAREINDLRAVLARLDAEVMATEAQLSAHGGDDIGDVLTRFEALRERARGLSGLLTERLRGIEKDRAAFVDRGLVASLEAESVRVAAELAEGEREAEALAPEIDTLARQEAELADARARFGTEWAEGVAVPSGRASEVRGELGALRSAAERAEGEVARLRARRDGLANDLQRIDIALDTATRGLAAIGDAEAPLVAAQATAERKRDAAETALGDARAALADAEAELGSWTARADGLAIALDDARARAGAEHLAGLDGMVGTLLDLVDIDEGWEHAFEAAVGEAMAAVVVDSIDTARTALRSFAAGNVSGAVLALGAQRKSTNTPSVGEPVRHHVRAFDPLVDELLDALLGGVVRIDGDLFVGIDVVLRHPEAVIVTRGGDRLSSAGWRLGGSRAQATRVALDEARRNAELARERRDAARAVLARATETQRVCDLELRSASKALDDHDSRVTAASEALRRVDAQKATLTGDIESLQARIDELSERIDRERARVRELEALLPQYEAEETELLERGRAMAASRSDIETRANAVGAIRTDLEVRAAGIEQRRQVLRRRLDEIEARLAQDAEQRAEAEQRRLALDRRQDATERLAVMVGERSAVVESELGDLRERRRRQSEAARAIGTKLESMRRDRHGAEQRLNELRELSSRIELEEAETRVRLEALVETVRREHDCEPEHAMAAESPALAEAMTAAGRIRELERDLKLMGPINPLALQEFQALQERHDFLEAQLEDIRSTRRDLNKVVRAIDEEIVSVFAAAFADVALNFEQLFDNLFPGGQGKLKLTDPDNLLETGIEIEARPSGKNVKKLSLLSGGERSLTALAFLFAVFRSRPSPFYVMDEVEAALDDVNLHRFLGLVDEFRNEAQLLIVSHQKRTMEAADCLYGVTMQPGGSSKLVAERMRQSV
ncbi:MAG TPA: chromosome segregation protein SMC [Acidimicrobiales bacterium]|nr:chromosome segregation protein SMC [Acidimicrobiales bacterium]